MADARAAAAVEAAAVEAVEGAAALGARPRSARLVAVRRTAAPWARLQSELVTQKTKTPAGSSQ